MQYLWWLFKSRVTMSTMLGIPILQLKTQKTEEPHKKVKKTIQCQKTETTTPQISINNLKMGPRAYIGHKLQI